MKKQMLCWADSPLAGTGFGIVSKHVLKYIHELFDIDLLAINFTGDFVDKDLFPYQMIPAKLGDPKDPYGNAMFLKALSSGKYDMVWVMNDLHVTEEVAKQIPAIIKQLEGSGKKVPKIVYYYPVDCQVLPEAKTMLQVSDHIVAYCKFGKDSTLKVLPVAEDKLSIINHGVDKSEFFPINKDERETFRKQFLQVKNEDTFVWMQVNRNSMRKDIARSILAFAQYKREVNDNSVFYIHTAPRDTTINLFQAVQDAGLTLKDVVFPNPKQYSAAKPYPVKVLNYFYNCGDAFLSTTLGEGWGLTHLEAASAGLPIVCPNNTCFPEQLAGGERGYLFDCKEKVWIDNSGYRPIALLDDIVKKMEECSIEVKNPTSRSLLIKESMGKYLDSIQWKNIGALWIDLLRKIDSSERRTTLSSSLGEVL
jgi:glycosyltransferase involved in cell wall biosynthesis